MCNFSIFLGISTKINFKIDGDDKLKQTTDWQYSSCYNIKKKLEAEMLNQIKSNPFFATPRMHLQKYSIGGIHKPFYGR